MVGISHSCQRCLDKENSVYTEPKPSLKLDYTNSENIHLKIWQIIATICMTELFNPLYTLQR